MVVASFLVKDLLIPWQAGAARFRDTLADADLANHTLGWQWTAGCGADLPHPWIHKPREAPREVWAAAEVALGDTYASPIVDHRAARDRALAALQTIRKSAG